MLGIPCTLFDLNPETELTAVSVADAMNICPGCLFIPYYESEQEIIEKVKQRAAAVMVEHQIPGIPCIVVQDLNEAVCCFCSLFTSVIRLPAVVVAGSEGKTTTKRMVKSVLQQEKQVFSQAGNYNTLQALCCSFQEVCPGDEIIVQEVDEKRINNTVNCSRFLKPDIALVTNIAEAHLGFYGSKEALTQSFLGITAGMDENGVVILNADDPDSLHAGFAARILTVGITNKNADCVASNITERRNGMEFDLKYENETVHVRLPMQGQHNVYNAMMAYLVGKLKGIGVQNILKGLSQYRNAGFRQNIVRFGRTLVYADCYNSSAKSMEFALKCFSGLPKRKGKKVAVIGDIAEIEGYEEHTYRQIASFLDASDVDVLITCGNDAESIQRYLNRRIECKHTKDLQELNRQLKQQKREGGRSYLFKASRFMHLERSIATVFPIHFRLMMLQNHRIR